MTCLKFTWAKTVLVISQFPHNTALNYCYLLALVMNVKRNKKEKEKEKK